MLAFLLGLLSAGARPSLQGALDVMLTLAANTTIVDGLAPDRGRIRKDFPYYGVPYTAEEQVGVRPMGRPAKK
jgi:hypothetical protein